jgi:hypothetical protein
MYDIIEGKQAVVGEIVITGYTKSSERGIRNLLDFAGRSVDTSEDPQIPARPLFDKRFREVTLRTETMYQGAPTSLFGALS